MNIRPSYVDILIFTGTFTGNMKSAGAYRIATELRRNGYKVQVVDDLPYIAQDSLEPLHNIIDKFVGPTTLWVGFSSTFIVSVRHMVQSHEKGKATERVDENKRWFNTDIPLTYKERFDLRSHIRRNSPTCKIVVGGGKATNMSAGIADVYVEGYADSTVVELTRWIQGKNPFLQYRVNPVNRFGLQSISLVHDVKADNFDFNRSAIEWTDRDVVLPQEALPIEVSRGCIFSCSFCSYPLNGKKKLDYIKDPDVLIREFETNYARFGTTDYVYSDDTHNDSPQKLETLYEKVYSKLSFKLRFYTYLRLDLLAAHPDTIPLLVQSGLRGAFFGIESLNYESAKSIGKGIKTDRAIETLYKAKSIWQYDVKTSGGFIVGLPHDTRETVENWLTQITDVGFPLDAVFIYPLIIADKPEQRIWLSEFEKNPGKYGYKFDEKGNWYNDYWDIYECQDIATRFMDRATENRRRQFSDFTIPGMLNLGFQRRMLHIGVQLTDIKPGVMYEMRQERLQKYLTKLMEL